MSLFKRIKRIGVGKSLVKIKEVNDITLKNGSSRVTLKLEREKDGATGTFFIVPDSFIIEKLLDVIFKDDYREEYKYDDVIGELILITVEENDYGYLGIKNIEEPNKYKESLEDNNLEVNEDGEDDEDEDEDYIFDLDDEE